MATSLNRGDPSHAANFVPWLIAELRAALSREEEAKKDAERMDVLSHALRHWDPELGMCIGDVFLSGGHSGVTIEVGNKIQEARGETLRGALDTLSGCLTQATRPVSLSENG